MLYLVFIKLNFKQEITINTQQSHSPDHKLGLPISISDTTSTMVQSASEVDHIFVILTFNFFTH